MHFLSIGIALFFSHFVCVLIHELAHLCAALAVGWRPLALCLGFGARRTLFQIGDLRIQVGSNPMGGFVEATALDPSSFRLKSFLFAAAGPLASAAVIAFVFKTLLQPERSPLHEPWTSAAGYLVVLESFILASNLWPRLLAIGDQWIPSDGMQMWRAITMKPKKIPEYFASHIIGYASRLFETGRTSQAQMLVEQVMSDLSPPDGLDQKMLYIHLLLLVGNEGAANAVCDELLAPEAPHGLPRAEVLDGLACLPIFNRHTQLIPRAMAWIDEAIGLAPDRITLKGTKGSLLIEQGNIEAGLEMLEEVRRTSTSEHDHAICSYYIALAHHRTGDWAKAEEHLHNAQADHPKCLVADWITRTIRGT